MKSLQFFLLLLGCTPSFCQPQPPAQQIVFTQSFGQNIVDLLWATANLPFAKTPKFKIDSGLEAVAMISRLPSDSLEIRVKTAFLAFLEKNMGMAADDALAIVIGHEITHGWQEEFDQKFASRESAAILKSENRADHDGLLLAHFAGYTAAFNVFDKIFEFKDLQSTRLDRKNTDDTLLVEAKNFAHLFSCAAQLTLCGNADALAFARAGFQEINADFIPFRELDFNRGLNHFLQATQRSGIRFAFPLELADPSVFPSRRSVDKDLKTDFENLRRARDFFKSVCREGELLSDINQQAALQNDLIFQAELGLACVLILEKKHAEALENLKVLLKKQEKHESRKDKIKIVEAIARFQNGEQESAKSLWTSLKNKNRCAKFNLEAAENPDRIAPPKTTCTVTAGFATAVEVHDRIDSFPANFSSRDMGDGVTLYQDKLYKGEWMLRKGSTEVVYQACSTCTCPSSSDWQTGSGNYHLATGSSASEFFVKDSKNGGGWFRITVLTSN